MKLHKVILIAICVLGAAVCTLVDGQTIRATAVGPETFTRLTAQDIKLLLEDVGEMNPNLLEGLREDPKLRKAQVENLRQLLAFASEAKRMGLADRKEYRNELEYIRIETTAMNYNRHVNKGKPAMPPFGHISDAAVARYFGEAPGSEVAAALRVSRKAKFEEFLNTKVQLLKVANPNMKELGTDEIEQARGIYAKFQIYAEEYQKRSAVLPLALRQKVRLQVKLQQAQFLARLYAEKVAAEVTASDAEIAAYLKAHPELDPSAKRAKAEKILARAKEGEDFAKLANEFSEDPGNKTGAAAQGGLYQNVGTGVMIPAFERAALALEPGQIAPQLVETDFGFHIVKLERKSVTDPQTYDVRHILIATTMDDPSDPNARPVAVKDFVRKKIESQKEKQVIDRIVAANKISVPDDFVVPVVEIKPPRAIATPKSKPRRARKRT